MAFAIIPAFLELPGFRSYGRQRSWANVVQFHVGFVASFVDLLDILDDGLERRIHQRVDVAVVEVRLRESVQLGHAEVCLGLIFLDSKLRRRN